MMTNEAIIEWLRQHAKGTEWSWRKVMLEAAKRLEIATERQGHWVPSLFFGHPQWSCSECQTLGSPMWKRCPVCEAKMKDTAITESSVDALAKIGQKVHKEE